MTDIIIIGGGPAGLTAALYALRANKSVLVIEKATFGGQITYSPKVENIPGFECVSGNEFAEKLVSQVLAQGADVEMAEVTAIKGDEEKTVIADGREYKAKAVIIAGGARHRLLGAKGEQELIGKGISFCAVCDGAFYKEKEVAVIGGGNSALQEALLLSDLAKKVTVVQNLDYLTGEGKLQEQLNKKDNVEVIYGSIVKEFIGTEEVKAIIIENAQGEQKINLDGVFVAIGLVPQNEPFKDNIDLNDYGYAVADESCKTRDKGIFVAGDCRSKKIRQVATAAADGAIAALAACDYIDGK